MEKSIKSNGDLLKKLKDLMNWIRSDLAEEEKGKLSKTMNPYRSEKLRFLRKLESIWKEQ